MSVSRIDSLHQVAASEWNALESDGNPFLRHEFLIALEDTHCANEHTGWKAQHLLLRDAAGALVGAAPLYLKTHSWGEFVFDFSWANAFADRGIPYYPKLVSAIPFTPASGPRLLTHSNASSQVKTELAQAMIDLAVQHDLSSVHTLFIDGNDLAVMTRLHFIERCDCQFHWRNRAYATFDDFIATFRADKRKKALRERRRVHETGIRFEWRHGAELSDSLWEQVFALSAATFARHGHEHYLNAALFKNLARTMPESIVVILAWHGDAIVGTAICFRGRDTLYGRYWGQAADYHSLHFETCYFQGIEYCIAHGLQSFEPGTQGEHKIARGFEPTFTHSAHWIADRRFAHAIETHLQREGVAVARYAEAMREHLPFHRQS